MPYYLIPQIKRFAPPDPETGLSLEPTTEPQVPGGIGWRGDTDGADYLLFADTEIAGRTALTAAEVSAEVQRRATAKGVPMGAALADAEKLSIDLDALNDKQRLSGEIEQLLLRLNGPNAAALTAEEAEELSTYAVRLSDRYNALEIYRHRLPLPLPAPIVEA
jgi:hypothetical protein